MVSGNRMVARIYRLFTRLFILMVLTYVIHSKENGTEILNNVTDYIVWKTRCHQQPLMNYTAVYVEGDEAEGTCRRCGKWTYLYEEKQTSY